MTYLQGFTDYLDEKGVKYQTDGETKVRVGYKMDNMSSVSVNVIFDKDGEGKVHFVVWSIGKFPDSKLMAGMAVCNALNAKYRWIKFYIDSDNEGCADLDAIVDEETVGPECYELMHRLLNIVDEAYPEIMRALYA